VEKSKKLRIVNLTPHNIDVFLGEKKVTIPPSGIVLRAVMEKEKINEVNGIPVYVVRYKLPELPPKKEGVIYIVSSVIMLLLKAYGIHRDDMMAPDTNSAIRVNGKIIGVRGLITTR